MTDIVARLRKSTLSASLSFDRIDAERTEAADEIERLQRLVEEGLFAHGERCVEIEQLRARVAELEHELEAEALQARADADREDWARGEEGE